MIEVIKRRFALSTKGAKDFCKGVFFTTLLDIVLMLPAVFVFLFLEEYLRPVFQPSASVTHGILYYSILGIVFMIVMYIFAVLQYRSTYTTVYDESANRRISLAEKLRKLPLAFFGEKNLSDLTATIMDDCTDLEHTFSHAVPQLFASIISILLITVGMAFYSDLDVIVDDEGYAIAAAEGGKLHGFLQKCRVVQLLFPQLDAGDAAFQRVFHLLAEGLAARPRPVGDGVEKHGVFIAFHSVLLPRAVRDKYHG
jgi:ABC-type multidrug transport system fused ATPase/permease subunit